jgi:hypothetical protein
MEMPMKLIVLLIIAVAVLSALMFFFMQSSGASMSKADAERTFSTMCLTYSQQGCEWAVTYEPAFEKYLSACRALYGQERDSYSCLYVLCERCFETADVKCGGLCHICEGHAAASIDRQTCCQRFSAQCRDQQCDVCATS